MLLYINNQYIVLRITIELCAIFLAPQVTVHDTS